MPFLLPDLFLLSISKPVIGLLPSKPIVQRSAMVLSFTSLISTSGGSGGSTRHRVEKDFVTSVLLKMRECWKVLLQFFFLWAVEVGAVIPCTVSCMIPLSSPKELMAWQEKKPESSLTVGMIWWMRTNNVKDHMQVSTAKCLTSILLLRSFPL